MHTLAQIIRRYVTLTCQRIGAQHLSIDLKNYNIETVQQFIEETNGV